MLEIEPNSRKKVGVKAERERRMRGEEKRVVGWWRLRWWRWRWCVCGGERGKKRKEKRKKKVRKVVRPKR